MKQGWEIKNIGSIADITDYVANGRFATLRENVSYLNEEGYAILVRLADFTNGFDSSKFVYIDEHAYNFLAKSKLYGGEIIMSNVGSIGKCFKCPDLNKPMSLAPNSIVIRTPNNDFYHYVFQSFYFQSEVKRISSQTALPKFNKTSFKNINVPVPPCEEQERIVEELDCLSGVIEKKKQQLKELDALAQSIFYTMFGDPITNEKGWEVKKLGEVARVIGGYAFKSNLFTEDGIPVLRIGNINTGLLKTTSIVFYREDEALTKYLVYPQDLVMSLTGTAGKDDYGNVCVLDDTYPKYYLNQRNAKFVLSGNIQVDYLKHVLKDKQIKSKLTGVNRGIRQGNIANRDIEELLVQIPPLVLQQEFADKIEAIEKQKELIKQSITETETLFNARMQYYFG